MLDKKLQWVVGLAITVGIFLFLHKSNEKFQQAYYPTIYKDYQLNDWHKYWQNKKSNNFLNGLPNYKSPAEASFKLKNHQFYPLPINGKYNTPLMNDFQPRSTIQKNPLNPKFQ